MKILVVGSGGREHALVWKISKSPEVNKIYCAPGNGGTSAIAENVNISSNDIVGLADFAESEMIDLTIVGPEIPLAAGIVDEFYKRDLKIFGPTKKGARLESSKIFAKEFMKKYNIPTADFEVFDNKEKAINFVKKNKGPFVVKADGLAGGKGVFVCNSFIEANDAIKQIMTDKKFGDSGNHVVIEEKLAGEEASMIVLCDGKNILPLVSSQDHKPIFDQDEGPNTGGMGAYSPAPVLESEVFDKTIQTIVKPLMRGIQKEIDTYKGVLYIGLMITKEGPKVLEFNVRFGDPEIQAILPRLKSDLLSIIKAAVEERLDKVELEWDNRACVCVVMASKGYPESYEKGKIITGIGEAEEMRDVIVFHAGTKIKSKELRAKNQELIEYITNGGRVLDVTALGNTIEDAIKKSYDAVNKIHFEDAYFRKDIGGKALKRSFNKC